MIANDTIADKTTNTLRRIATSELRFFLTGSRRFGTNHASSDFDFFTEYSPAAEEFVSDFFKLDPVAGSWDINTYGIYRKGLVDVALLYSPVARIVVEEAIQTRPGLLKLLKSSLTTPESRRDTWNVFYREFGTKHLRSTVGESDVGRVFGTEEAETHSV